MTALARTPHQAAVEMLLAVSANVNARDSVGSTPLLEAARAGHDDIIGLLLSRGAKLGVESGQVAGLLASAVAAGDTPQLGRLLRCGVDASAVDYDGMSPTHVAAAAGNLAAVRRRRRRIACGSVAVVSAAAPTACSPSDTHALTRARAPAPLR